MIDTQTTLDLKQKKALDYIKSLELPPLPTELARFKEEPTILDDAPGAYVSAGNIVSFIEGLTKLHKQDVLNSTLLAQLAANKAFNRETDTVKWYAKYTEVLSNVGWDASDWKFTKFTTHSETFDIEGVVLALISAIASSSQLAMVVQALSALKALASGSKGFNLWNSQTHDSQNGNFQIAPCAESDGNVAMALGAFYFSAKSVDHNFLWFRYTQLDVSLYQSGQTVVLNEQAYAYVRQQVIDKLGDNAVKYVADLDI